MAYIVKQGIKYEIESKYYRDGQNLQYLSEREKTKNPLEVYHIRETNDLANIWKAHESKRCTPEMWKCKSFDRVESTSNIESNLQPLINISEDQNDFEDKDGFYGKHCNLPKMKDTMQYVPELKEKYRSRKKYSSAYEMKGVVHLLQEIQNDIRNKNDLYNKDKSGIGNRNSSKFLDLMQLSETVKNEIENELFAKDVSWNKDSSINKIKDAIYLYETEYEDNQDELYDNDESRDKNKYLPNIQDQINHCQKIKNEDHRDKVYDKDELSVKYNCLSKIQDLINHFRKMNEDRQDELCDKNEARNKNSYLYKIRDQINFYLHIMDEDESRDKSSQSKIQKNLFKKIKIESNEDSLYAKDESTVKYCRFSEIQEAAQFFQEIKNENRQDEQCDKYDLAIQIQKVKDRSTI